MSLTLAKIKSKLNGKELDLSALDLKDVPAKELGNLPKATHIDLSVNKLTTIPPAFCNLTHIVKLELGKNQLKQLPENFGQLTNLQHLDLFSNSLTILPESFYNLTNLKWLDLKNNPLDAQLKAVAGECQSAQDCRTCAKKVVAFMRNIHEELEKEREKKLQKAKAKEALKQKREEAKKEKLRQEKKAAKEKRRDEIMKKQQEQQAKNSANKANGVNSKKTQKTKEKKHDKPKKVSSKKKTSTLFYFLLSLFVLAFAALFWRYLGKNFPNNLTKEDFHKVTNQITADAYELYRVGTAVGADLTHNLLQSFHKTVEFVNNYWQQT